MSYVSIEQWNEPRILLENDGYESDMMSRDEHGFLCSLIRKKRPVKILELGVARGGTTQIIMQALAMLDLESKVYSVDLAERCFVCAEKKTGYLYEEKKDIIGGRSRYELLLGKTIAERIEEITSDGEKFDFVVIDTIHILPGELIDFLCILPYVKDEGIVVLHDVLAGFMSVGAGLEKYRKGWAIPYQYTCTRILLASVTSGTKYYNMSSGNIAALEVNEETRANVQDVFMALCQPWAYSINDELIAKYDSVFRKHYDDFCVETFRSAVNKNKSFFSKMPKDWELCE